MGSFSVSDAEKFESSQGGSGFFSLKNDKDVARVRFLFNDIDGVQCYSVHQSEITYCGYNCPNRDCERHYSHSRYTYDSFAWFDSCPNRPRGEYWIDLTDYCPSDYGVGAEPVEEPLWNWECPNCGEHIFDVENPPSKCPTCGIALQVERR